MSRAKQHHSLSGSGCQSRLGRNPLQSMERMSSRDKSTLNRGPSYGSRARPDYDIPPELIVDPNEPDWDYGMTRISSSSRRKTKNLSDKVAAVVLLQNRVDSLRMCHAPAMTANCTRRTQEKHEFQTLHARSKTRQSTRPQPAPVTKELDSPLNIVISVPSFNDEQAPTRKGRKKDRTVHVNRDQVAPDERIPWKSRTQSPPPPSCFALPNLLFSTPPPTPPRRSASALKDGVSKKVSPQSVAEGTHLEERRATPDELHELKRELADLKRWASCVSVADTTVTTITKAAKRVRFAHPIVTSLKYRPKTLPEECPSLYFREHELRELEADRENQVYDDQVECIATGNPLQDQLRVSIAFPNRVITAPSEPSTSLLLTSPTMAEI